MPLKIAKPLKRAKHETQQEEAKPKALQTGIGTKTRNIKFGITAENLCIVRGRNSVSGFLHLPYFVISMKMSVGLRAQDDTSFNQLNQVSSSGKSFYVVDCNPKTNCPIL